LWWAAPAGCWLLAAHNHHHQDDGAQPLFVIIAVVTAYSISNYEYGIAETVTSPALPVIWIPSPAPATATT